MYFGYLPRKLWVIKGKGPGILDIMQEFLQANTVQMQVFKALADTTRLEIVKILKDSDHEMTCGEIGKIINISKTSGSYHFKLLQEAGLITVRKEAREKYVQLDPATFEQYVTNFYQTL